MVMSVHSFDFIVTETEIEALTLECSLIKQHKPKYNILLKDDKGYSYIKISDEAYPRITAEKQKDKTGSYLGPFMSFFTVRQSVEAANNAFKLPTCKRVFPRDFGKERPCLNFHIGLCDGVCKGHISAEAYNERLQEAVMFIKSGEKTAVEKLKKEMEECSENLEFEKAASIRDRIRAITRITERQTVRTEGKRDKDFIAFVKYEKGVMASVVSFKSGVLRDKADFSLDLLSEEDMLRNFITEFYENRDIPEYIVLEESTSEKELLEEYLKAKKGKAVRIVSASSGENKKMLSLAIQNAAEKIAFLTRENGTAALTLSELSGLLGLGTVPRHIESADISNTGADAMVGVIVVFKNGQSFKKWYKKFSINGLTTENDTAAIAEVFRRRFKRHLDPNETDEGFKARPDLILVDGGKGQVNAVKGVLSELGLDISVFGIVKDEHHRTRAITDGKGEISIKRTHLSYKLCATIGEEVHRFAITTHRKKRNKNSMSLTLTKVHGVGEKTAAKIMRKFGSLRAVSVLTPKELSSGAGVPLKTAEKIINFLQNR
jgi:excinuclease ABC subunit C